MFDDFLVEHARTGVVATESQLERIGQCEVLLDVLASRGYSTLSLMASNQLGSESSMDKLFLSHVEQSVTGLAFDMLGAYRAAPSAHPDRAGERWLHDYLYGRAGSIYGGTSQIQREIIGRRILGLPSA